MQITRDEAARILGLFREFYYVLDAEDLDLRAKILAAFPDLA